MAVDTCGQGWTTVDVCVAMFLDEGTEVRDNSACVTKDVRFHNGVQKIELISKQPFQFDSLSLPGAHHP